MASPAVAGAAALLLQRHPAWTPADVKVGARADARPRPVAAPPLTVGAGFADVAAADATPLLADSAAVRFGVVRPGVTAAPLAHAARRRHRRGRLGRRGGRPRGARSDRDPASAVPRSSS